MQPKIYFSQSIEARKWQVWRPTVKLGEYHGTLFFYVDLKDVGDRELATPPRGLYGKEFLELDYHDPFQLMAFQKKWGPITGLRAQPNKTFDVDTYVDVEINKSFYSPDSNSVFHANGIMATAFMYEGYGSADIIAHERYGTESQTLSKVVNENWLMEPAEAVPNVNVVPCHVATIEEVAEAVCDAQVVIRAITNIMRSGYSQKEWDRDRGLVLDCVRYCNAVLSGAVSSVDIIEDNNREGVCTLMQYLFIGLARGAMLNNAYRNCKYSQCGRLFSPREYNRRTDSMYCSEECQVKAKYYRVVKQERSSIGEGKQSFFRETDDDTLEISWSVTGIPLRKIKKSQMMRSIGDEDPIQNDEYLQNALYLSFGGLAVNEPGTAEILKKLTDKSSVE